MHSKSWVSNLAIALAAVAGMALVTGARVQTQSPFVVFGSNSGVAQPIKATANALWVSIQSGTVVGNLVPSPSNSLNLGSSSSMWGTVYTSAVTAITGSALDLGANGANFWRIATTGHLITPTDNTYDIGAAGATRPRTGYLGTSLNVAAGSTYASTADKLTNVLDNAGATGLQLNMGTPTLGTCTGGSMVSGSHNFGGEVTGNTSGSCVINFGTPNFTNTPFCFLNDETTLTAIRVSARSASSITVTGAVSADAFQFLCIGRIGT